MRFGSIRQSLSLLTGCCKQENKLGEARQPGEPKTRGCHQVGGFLCWRRGYLRGSDDNADLAFILVQDGRRRLETFKSRRFYLEVQPFMEASKQQPERKTLDQRDKLTELERIRHSCAHVMATAILRLWPDAQFASGPPVENGFYYDVDLEHRISPEDFPKIEEEMKKEIKANNTFEKIIVTREQALKDSESGRLGGLTERPGNPSKFKIGNLEAIPEGEPITYFKNGDFIDLCAGPHVMRTGNIGAFKLTKVASAYY